MGATTQTTERHAMARDVVPPSDPAAALHEAGRERANETRTT